MPHPLRDVLLLCSFLSVGIVYVYPNTMVFVVDLSLGIWRGNFSRTLHCWTHSAFLPIQHALVVLLSLVLSLLL